LDDDRQRPVPRRRACRRRFDQRWIRPHGFLRSETVVAPDEYANDKPGDHDPARHIRSAPVPRDRPGALEEWRLVSVDGFWCRHCAFE
jgi:hypothetical protein